MSSARNRRQADATVNRGSERDDLSLFSPLEKESRLTIADLFQWIERGFLLKISFDVQHGDLLNGIQDVQTRIEGSL